MTKEVTSLKSWPSKIPNLDRLDRYFERKNEWLESQKELDDFAKQYR